MISCDHYENFMLLSTAIAILIDQEMSIRYADSANKLLIKFISHYVLLYNPNPIIYTQGTLSISFSRRCETVWPWQFFLIPLTVGYCTILSDWLPRHLFIPILQHLVTRTPTPTKILVFNIPFTYYCCRIGQNWRYMETDDKLAISPRRTVRKGHDQINHVRF